jgi:DNA-binding XRE family transcriptional regulator
MSNSVLRQAALLNENSPPEKPGQFTTPRRGVAKAKRRNVFRIGHIALKVLLVGHFAEMPRSAARTYSRYTQQALNLLGGLLRAARIEKKIGTQVLAERAGISRDMLYRIEKGDPRCEIGVVFELAAILGVPLFEPDAGALTARAREVQQRLALLPKSVHVPRDEVKDDF